MAWIFQRSAVRMKAVRYGKELDDGVYAPCLNTK